MNKEKLEQMKKEKLEQMKELGRGGISRGLSLLQKANTALATNANGALGDDATATASGGSGSGSDAAQGESATLLTGASGKPSYDDLVALSMKLTRQNKLMKAQFQKMQARIAELQTSDLDCRVLSAFVSDVVGVDVVACQRAADGDATSDGDTAAQSTIDVKQLRERLEILDALKTKALKQQIAQLQMQVAANETNMSLSLLPTAPAPAVTVEAGAAASVPQYEEIDLLGDAFGSPPTARAQPSPSSPPPQPQQVPSAFSDDLLSFDFPAPVPTAAASSTASSSQEVAALEQQLRDATEQLGQMEAEMQRVATEKEELRRKASESWKQRTTEVEQLKREKHALERRVEAASTDAQAQAQQAEQRVAALQTRIDELQAQTTTTASSDTTDGAAAETEALREQLVEKLAVNEQLNEQLAAYQASSDKANATIRALEASIESLNAEIEQLTAEAQKSAPQAAQAGTSMADVDSTSAEVKMAALQERIAELEAANDTLQQELSTAASASAAAASTDNSQDVAALLDELERVKMARAETDHAAKSLQDKLASSDAKLAAARNDVEQNTAVVAALRAEIARLVDEATREEGEHAAATKAAADIQAEMNKLEEAKEALEEQLEVLRANNNSNLESVVGELAAAKKEVAEQREYTNGKIEVLVRELDAARKQSEALEEALAEKDKQNQKMAASQAALTSEVVTLQKQVSSMEQDLQMAAEGLEAHASKADESELRRKETDEKLQNARLQIETLKDQHLSDLEMMRSEKEAELDRVRGDRSQLQKKLGELEAAFNAISLKYSALQDELEREKKRAHELETRLAQLTAELGNLSIDLAETKKALSDRMALATRLQTENMGFAETQAEQAARVESALREAAASKQIVAESEAKVQAAKAEVHKFMAERDGAVDEMAKLLQEIEHEKQNMTQQLETQAAKYKAAVEAEKHAFRRELERVESDSKHKSKLALHAVLEKEAEIERLSKRLAHLEEDVRSGDADNRKIFEFAQMQASRELEARANGAKIHELTRELEAANARIHELQLDQSRHGEELTAMMQTQRREGVNMEYLKNVIVQYMSFKPGSSQQLRLVPVITTLLQFTAADMKEVKKASGRRSSWGTWGAEVPDYKPIAGVGANGAEAVTTSPHARRRTSPPTSMPSSGFENRSMPPRASSFTLPPHDEDGAASGGDPAAAHCADF